MDLSTFFKPFLFVVLTLPWLTTGQVLQRSAMPTTYTLCILFERNTTGKIYDYNRGAAAIDLAFRYVEENLLPQPYRLQKVYRDLGDVCAQKTHVAAQAMDLIQNGVECHAFFGPGCGLATEALNSIAEFYDIPIIGVPAAEAGFSASFLEYTMIMRVSVPFRAITSALIKFFNSQGYTSISFFEDSAEGFFKLLATLSRATVSSEYFELFSNSQFKQFDSTTIEEEAIRAMFQEVGQRSRVVVMYADAVTVRKFMLVAHRMGLTNGEWVFVAVELFSSNVWGRYTWRMGDQDDAISRRAFRSLLILSLQPDYNADTDVFWQEVKKESSVTYGYNYGADEQLDPVVVHMYDAAVIFGTIVADNVKANRSWVGRDVVAEVANNTISSPISGDIYFDSASDRTFDFIMRSYDFKTGKHEALYAYPGRGGPSATLAVLDWYGNNTLPPNQPRCGYRGDDPVCQEKPRVMSTGERAAAVIVSLILGTTLIIAGYQGVKRVFFHDDEPFWWRIFLHEVESSLRGNARSEKSLGSEGQSILKSTKTVGAKEDDESVEKGKQVEVEQEERKCFVSIAGVTMNVLEITPKRVTPSMQEECRRVRVIQHNNLQKFVGIIVDESNQCVYIVGELCTRGTMRDLLADTHMDLDWAFKNSLLKDLSNGLAFLHTTKIVSHGFLYDETIFIDSRFVLKIAGYGFGSLQDQIDLMPASTEIPDRDWRVLMWRAPELLRRTMPDCGTPKGDVYSFAIVMQQIILRTDPFELPTHGDYKMMNDNPKSMDIVMEVKRGTMPPTRPNVPLSSCPPEIRELMEACWEEDPHMRPPMSRVRMTLLRIVGREGDNIVDHLIRRMEEYSSGLEKEVEQKTKQFMEERQRSQALLLSLLPKIVANALLRGETILPRNFTSTTVYFGDVPGFSKVVESLHAPKDVVSLLNQLYDLYDEILPKYDVFQVEAVNDAILVVSGIPEPNGSRHVKEIASMAIDIKRKINVMKFAASDSAALRLRAGINSGPCVAGVVGLRLPRYCLFGDTVNTASRMESHGEPNKIHCSESSKKLLETFPEFILLDRGTIEIKGKGPMSTYWVIGKD